MVKVPSSHEKIVPIMNVTSLWNKLDATSVTENFVINSSRSFRYDEFRGYSDEYYSSPMHRFPLVTRVYLPDRSGQTRGVRFQYTGPVWPVTGRNRSNSNLNSNFAVKSVRTGIPAGLTGIPVGLTGNRSNSNFFLFWFKFKCPQKYTK